MFSVKHLTHHVNLYREHHNIWNVLWLVPFPSPVASLDITKLHRLLAKLKTVLQ